MKKTLIIIALGLTFGMAACSPTPPEAVPTAAPTIEIPIPLPPEFFPDGSLPVIDPPVFFPAIECSPAALIDAINLANRNLAKINRMRANRGRGANQGRETAPENQQNKTTKEIANNLAAKTAIQVLKIMDKGANPLGKILERETSLSKTANQVANLRKVVGLVLKMAKASLYMMVK